MNQDQFATTAAWLGYAHNGLDRLAAHRDDPAFVAALRADPAARTLVVQGEQVVLRKATPAPSPWFGLEQAAALGRAAESVFLGRDAAGPAFALLLDESVTGLEERPGVMLANLRALAVDASVSPEDLGALAQGKALLFWHSRHRHCATCGAPTAVAAAGWRRECPACAAQHFPRTDPVVIMLAVQGERCLMGRQPRFPPRMYSCLAGFLEPGETVEAAVRREIAEEAGIATRRVTYLGSQPWPFPASLMIGCIAEAVSTDITIDRDELEDARWFTREEVRLMAEGRHPDGLLFPVRMAIAHHIVRAWLDG